MAEPSTDPRTTTPSHTQFLETCIRHRHSIRFYKPDAVPREVLLSCFALAQLAPSNSNIQNWRLTVASGAARDRIVSALQTVAATHGPNIPPLPEHFQHFRSEYGHLLYGARGYDIPRDDREAHRTAQLRNYAFFDAPVCAVVSMDAALEVVDAMSVGMFLQTFMLALTERGLGSCLQVSVMGYPEVLRGEFGLEADQLVLCGMSIGWPEERHPVNEVEVPREEVEKCVTFLVE